MLSFLSPNVTTLDAMRITREEKQGINCQETLLALQLEWKAAQTTKEPWEDVIQSSQVKNSKIGWIEYDKGHHILSLYGNALSTFKFNCPLKVITLELHYIPWSTVTPFLVHFTAYSDLRTLICTNNNLSYLYQLHPLSVLSLHTVIFIIHFKTSCHNKYNILFRLPSMIIPLLMNLFFLPICIQFIPYVVVCVLSLYNIHTIVP